MTAEVLGVLDSAVLCGDGNLPFFFFFLTGLADRNKTVSTCVKALPSLI